MEEVAQYVMEGKDFPRYWYSLDLISKGPGDVQNELLQRAHAQTRNQGELMSDGELHVTMWFKTTPGGDEDYLERLKKQHPIWISLTKL